MMQPRSRNLWGMSGEGNAIQRRGWDRGAREDLTLAGGQKPKTLFAVTVPGCPASAEKNRNRSSVFLQHIDFLLSAPAFRSSFQQAVVE